jgi:hypothetical protein
MAQTVVVNVVVEELSKYGFKANGKYVGLSKQLSESDKAKIVPGASFEAEYYVSDNGKEYLNKILTVIETAPRNSHPGLAPKVDTKPDTERAKKFTPKYEKKADATSAGLSKDEWAAKDRRISRQGCIQVAVQVQSDFDEAVKLAEKMLEFVNG